MRKTKTILILLLLGALVLSGCGKTQPPEPDPTPEPTAAITPAPVSETPPVDRGSTSIEQSLSLGDMLPNFTAELCDGELFSLAQELQTHDAVMIYLWSTKLGPCYEQLLAMQEVYEAYADRVSLVCLSSWETGDELAKYAEDYDLNLPFGTDTVGLDAAVVWEGYPTTILIDRFGCYVYYYCGPMTDRDAITRLWDYYLREDYAASEVLEKLPERGYEGELPEDEELNAVLCPDGSLRFKLERENAYIWPFLPDGDHVVNSNALAADTTARLSTEPFSAQEGDAFSMEYSLNVESTAQMLDISVNGTVVKSLALSGEGHYVYAFPKDGEYVIELSYREKLSAAQTNAAGTVHISNAMLLTGHEAAVAIKSQPIVPHALRGEKCSIESATRGLAQIELVFPKGMDELAQEYTQQPMAVYNSDTLRYRVLLGDALDPELAYCISDAEGRLLLCAQAEQDERGYLMETRLYNLENDGISHTTIQLFPDVRDLTKSYSILVLSSAENLNYYIAHEIVAENGQPIEGIRWLYQDGRLPSTKELAEPGRMERFQINVVDEEGNPVDGVELTITDINGSTTAWTSDGYYGFDADPYPYEVRIAAVPDGYEAEMSEEYELAPNGDCITITISHR